MDAIDTFGVEWVLLPDGKWYEVEGHSFTIADYKYVEEERYSFSAGLEQTIPRQGASWCGPDDESFACPMTSVMAVRGRAVTINFESEEEKEPEEGGKEKG